MNKIIILSCMFILLAAFAYAVPTLTGFYLNENHKFVFNGTAIYGINGSGDKYGLSIYNLDSTYDLGIAGDAGAGSITNAETLSIIGAGSVSTSFDGVDTLTITGAAGGSGNCSADNSCPLITYDSELDYNSTNDIWQAISNNTFANKAFYSSSKCAGTDKVVNVSYYNGDIAVVCAADVSGGAGGGAYMDVYADNYMRFNTSKGATEDLDLNVLNSSDLCVGSKCITAWSQVNGSGDLSNYQLASAAYKTANFTVDYNAITSRYTTSNFTAQHTITTHYALGLINLANITGKGYMTASNYTLTFPESYGLLHTLANHTGIGLMSSANYTTRFPINYGLLHTVANHTGIGLMSSSNYTTQFPISYGLLHTTANHSYINNCSADLSCDATLLYESELNTIAELNTQIADATLLISGGTLTSSKWCVYDGAGIDCNVEPVTDTNTNYWNGTAGTTLNMTTFNITNSYGQKIWSNTSCFVIQGDDGSQLKVGSAC